MQRQLPQHDGLLFPAYAGVILITHILQFGSVPFPRIRGGDPKYNNGKLRWLMLFPAYAGVIPTTPQTTA